MKRTTLFALVFSIAILPTVSGVEVTIKTTTDLRERLNPDRVLMQIPAGATFEVELVEGEWLLGVYMHGAGVSRGMIRKETVVDPEKLAKLEEEYQQRVKIREEQEMLAKGYVKYEGKWVTPQERDKLEQEKFEKEMITKGLVKFEGKWITPDERAEIIKQRYATEVETLISTLKDATATPEQKSRAENRLIDIKEPAIGPLIAELKGKDRGMRGTAAVLLGKIGGKEVLKPLVAALEDEDACAGAATGLGYVRERGAVDELIKALQDEDAVRAAAEALGKIGDVRAVDPLIKVMLDFYEDDATHAAAAKALGLIGDRKALGQLQEVMEKDKNPLVRDAAREAYNKIKASLPPGG
jgi:hypothetical protein